MKFVLRIILLAFLLTGTFSQEGFDLGDALDDSPKGTQPTQKPKGPGPKNDDALDLLDAFGPDPVPKKPKEPKSGDGLDLLDAFGPDEPAPEKPKKPKSGGNAGFDLEDALGPDDPKKPAVNPGGGGGGSFSDSDLLDVNHGDYKPDGGRSSGGNSGYDSNGGAEQPKESSGAIAAIASSIGVALLGAASSYFAYQKKKLCFKLQGGQDPESGKHHGDNQVSSNLMRNS
ncbi:CD99 molecule isoform 1-T1 [Synchiropus picturatus]